MSVKEGRVHVTPSAVDRRGWFERILAIRFFEEKVQELFMDGLVEGTTHLCQGQEAISVGSTAALSDDDYMTITYRGHGHALARGMPPEAAFGELMGRTIGCCHGVGGSMHLTDFSRGLIGSFAIIGAGLSVAVGAALSAQRRGDGRVALAYCGDGATNIGTFHEALNMAAVWHAPVVFIVENNLYAEYTPLQVTTAVTDLAQRGVANGIRSRIVDGQDVDAVYEAVLEAVAHARGDEGPSLLEMKTYRFRGHSRTDPAKYRSAGELEKWLERDPVTLLERRLRDEGVLSDDEAHEIRVRVQKEIDDAAATAAASPPPTLDAARAFVYASRELR